METKNNEPENPPAFPTVIYNQNSHWDGRYEIHAQHEGLSLRDYFAAKAMQGICAHPDTWGDDLPGIAEHAYELADAMLAARQKGAA